MPGFMVEADYGGMPGKPITRTKLQFYYNYTWDISSLFGTTGYTSLQPVICLRDATLPSFTVNKETKQGASLEYKFAKSVTWDDIKVSWYDSEGMLQIVRTWRQSVWTPEAGLKMAAEYKQPSVINSFLPTGGMENRWELHNSWPSQIKYGDLTYTSSEVKLVDVVITYDWAEERPAST